MNLTAENAENAKAEFRCALCVLLRFKESDGDAGELDFPGGTATLAAAMETVFRHQLVVGPNATDPNGHVNNVAYVQWMQDSAVAHSSASGCTRITQSLGATWVVRSHQIEYRSPAFAGDAITILTWVENFRRVRSLRRYKIVRDSDGAVLAEGDTDWVFVDAKSGRPKAIPREIEAAFGEISRTTST